MGAGGCTAADTLALTGIVQLGTAAAFFFVGRELANRRGTEGAASIAFSTWWMGIATFLVLESAVTLLAWAGSLSLGVLLAIRYAGFLLAGAAFWGLTYFVVFVWTGRSSLRIPLAVYFGALALALVAFAATHGPRGVEAREWAVALDFETPVEGPLHTLLLAGYALPPIAASVGYLSLFPRVPRRDQRYRVALVGLSVILYLGSGFVARLVETDAIRVLNLAVGGPGTALAALLAFHPPRAWHAWLGLVDKASLEREREEERRARRETLAARCRELV